MKILVLIDVRTGAPMTKIRDALADELKGSWQLFTEDVLREAYTTSSPTRIVFVLEVASEEAARARLAALPLFAAGYLTAEYIELRPFVNWRLLFA